MPGTSSTNSSISLAQRSIVTVERPVILPPGRARLVINPKLKGSPAETMTMGIAGVARRAAIVAGVPHATITSTLLLISSATGLGSCSNVPCGQRTVDGQVLPFDVAALAHTVTERAQHGRRRRHGCENPDAPNLQLLRVRRERPRSRSAEKRDELAPPHSITSSARASTVAGMSMPSVFAVLRLITSSYLVGACTGRSAGFSPLRMRST